MNEGKFFDSINRGIKLLRQCALLESADALNVKNASFNKFSKDFICSSVKNKYKKTYTLGIENNDYDILLMDNAFFQFCSENEKLRFAFYPNPDQVKNYKEFLSEMGFLDDEVGDAFVEDYHQFLSESDGAELVYPVRYDYDKSLYIELVHPVSHIHIGVNNQIRLCCGRELTPFAFIAIIMKNFYPNYWKVMLDDPNLKATILLLKKSCTKLSCEVFSIDEAEYFFIE